jgi:ferredoxin--NADP+ reductase
MFRIISKEILATKIHLFKIKIPAIAKKALARGFVATSIDERGERIPSTLADWDAKEDSVTTVFMEVGATTFRLALLKAVDLVIDFVGLLGVISHVGKFGSAVCVAGGG